MATYDFKCTNPDCENVQEEVMKISEKDTKKITCNECGNHSVYIFTPTICQVRLKGDGWPSKSEREKNYRKKRTQIMKKRQEDHVKKPELRPNFNGEMTGTWADAQAAAHDAGKNISSYDNLVQKEKAGKKSKGSIVTTTK